MKIYKVTVMVSEEGRFDRDSYRFVEHFLKESKANEYAKEFENSNFHKVFIDTIEVEE